MSQSCLPPKLNAPAFFSVVMKEIQKLKSDSSATRKEVTTLSNGFHLAEGRINQAVERLVALCHYLARGQKVQDRDVARLRAELATLAREQDSRQSSDISENQSRDEDPTRLRAQFAELALKLEAHQISKIGSKESAMLHKQSEPLCQSQQPRKLHKTTSQSQHAATSSSHRIRKSCSAPRNSRIVPPTTRSLRSDKV